MLLYLYAFICACVGICVLLTLSLGVMGRSVILAFPDYTHFSLALTTSKSTGLFPFKSFSIQSLAL